MFYTLIATGEVINRSEIPTLFPNETISGDITPEIEQRLGIQQIPTPPKCITKRQATLMLFDTGLLGAIESFLTQNERAFIEWQAATEVCRDNPLIDMVKLSMNMTDEQIDQLFITGSIL
jgi:hypothetical protein